MSSNIHKESFKVTTSHSGVRSFGEHDDRSSPPSWRGGGRMRSRGGGSRGGGGGRRYGGYNDRKRKNRNRGGRGGYQGGRGGHRSGPYPRSRLEDDDGDVAMDDDVSREGASRYAPYGPRPPTRRENRPSGSMARLGLPVDSNDRKGRRGGRSNDNDNYTWARITVLDGRKLDKKWLLETLQNLCEFPFQPVDFYYFQRDVSFFVDDRKVGVALRALSRRVTTQNGEKLIILMKPCSGPTHHPSKSSLSLDDSQLEVLKQVMSKRFNPTLQALDLGCLSKDSDLQSQNIQGFLSREPFMTAVTNIISENIPQMMALNVSDNRLYNLDRFRGLVEKVPNLQKLSLSKNGLKSDLDLVPIKGWKLLELDLDGNPLCDNYNDQSSYIRAVKNRFPKLVKLDGHELPPTIGFDLDSPSTTLPETKGSFFVNETLQTLILKFLEQYYAVYDSDDRQKLLDAYHDKACFSLTIPPPPPPPPRDFQRPKPQSLQPYIEYSRSIRRISDREKLHKSLKHGKVNVVALLNELPETQHDPASFIIDVSMATNTLLNFSISGLFKETNTSSHQMPIRAFTRTFLAVPAGSGLSIINDHLCIMRPTPNQQKGAFTTPAPTPSTSPVPPEVQQTTQVVQPVPSTSSAQVASGFTAQQQQAIQSFSQQSGMNFDWSQKCLAENNWDYELSARVFTELHAKGAIPQEAFIK